MKPFDFSTFPIVETDRFTLRRLLLTDAAEIYELRSDVEVAVLTGKAPYQSLNDATAYINKIDNLVNNNESIYWVIAEQETGPMIGAVCLWDFNPETRTIEMGYELLRAFQGKGIMLEVIPRILNYAFEVMGVQTIVAFPSSDNPPSVKLLERLGFDLVQEDHKNTHQGVPGMLTYTFSAPES
ncbi:GNAT family N-acetyltransferase [Pedobacter sp. HDW13]|uniref:GNAT family N-acetyltransferase n=1 Tax=Pedobacter sp. HDW13 TaxID=2714940 RepID=UPI00140D0877|nr:GNAT family N-acetyltransferase [Pedobacter sp. HDW13]QIL40447.1 GNAT family N-acetyltransferase [Pedobacter sp. HDW13]